MAAYAWTYLESIPGKIIGANNTTAPAKAAITKKNVLTN